MSDTLTFTQILAQNCGGHPEIYEVDLSKIRNLEEAATTDKSELESHTVPVEFSELDIC